MTVWTDEKIDSLKKLWADGLSCSQIANELGVISRSAVIGKVHRLGLPGRDRKPQSGARVPRRPRRSPSAPPRIVVKKSVSPLALALEQCEEVDDTPQIEAAIIPLHQRKDVLQLTEETCKWPIGDPQKEGFFFCGAVSAAGLPYCPRHARKAYQS